MTQYSLLKGDFELPIYIAIVQFRQSTLHRTEAKFCLYWVRVEKKMHERIINWNYVFKNQMPARYDP